MELKKHKCPSCNEMTLTVYYDKVTYDSYGEETCMDYYECSNCGGI